MRVVVLGAVEVVDAPMAAPSGEIARRVLAILAADANRPVHPERLADLVWPGDHRPGGNTLQAHISRWRKALGAHRITYSPAGYTLVVGPDELDALEFEELAHAATAAAADGRAEAALPLCDRALALWQGAAFDGLGDDGCVRDRSTVLETTRAAVRLTRLELWCAAGEHEQVVREAGIMSAAQPWSEPVHRLLARAHYGRGDQVAALQVLGDLELRLREELGLDLGAATQLLRTQILRQEPALDLTSIPSPQPPISAPAGRLADRVASFSAATQHVLRTAGLCGVDLDTPLLARVLEVDGPALADALAPALAAGILVRTDDGVRFAGAAVRDAVAALVPAGEAIDLHRRLGTGLLSGGTGGPDGDRRAAEHLAAAASTDVVTAQWAVDLDRRLARSAMDRGQYDDAARHARRALVSAAHVPADAGDLDRAEMHLTVGEALQRTGGFTAAMTAFRAAAREPGTAPETLARSALAHEECSLHGRRHRTGARDPSIVLLEQALAGSASIRGFGPGQPGRVDLLASLAQALAFAGLDERAVGLADAAVAAARSSGDPETLTRALLRAVAVQDPVTGAATRLALAAEATEASRSVDADELEVEALCAWVPELMRAGRLEETEQVVARVEHLVDVHDNMLHRCKVPMWRAALALFLGRWDEAEVLIEDFRETGRRDGYDDTDRIHGFQSILLALGRRTPDQAAAVLDRFADDGAFEPWQAATLLVAHARDDDRTAQRVLVPWSARRFALSRPFAGVQVFCACLVAEAVAARGDDATRARLAALVRVGVGRHQVLGAGAAMLGDAVHALDLLTKEAVHG